MRPQTKKLLFIAGAAGVGYLLYRKFATPASAPAAPLPGQLSVTLPSGETGLITPDGQFVSGGFQPQILVDNFGQSKIISPTDTSTDAPGTVSDFGITPEDIAIAPGAAAAAPTLDCATLKKRVKIYTDLSKKDKKAETRKRAKTIAKIYKHYLDLRC